MFCKASHIFLIFWILIQWPKLTTWVALVLLYFVYKTLWPQTRNVTYNIFHLTSLIHKSLDISKPSLSIFMDLSKGLNTICNERLLDKPENISFTYSSHNSLLWMTTSNPIKLGTAIRKAGSWALYYSPCKQPVENSIKTKYHEFCRWHNSPLQCWYMRITQTKNTSLI